MTPEDDSSDWPDDPATTTLHLKGSPDVLDIRAEADRPQEILEEMCAFAESRTRDERALYVFRLVCDEFLVNIASYAYEEGNGPVYAAVDGRDGLRVIIRDRGIAFNPLEDAKVPDVEAPLRERDIGGCGIMLSKEFAKKLEYLRIGEWNVTIATII
ncbi:MAG: ATP-binding protein [Thermoplasmata archaeon]|nr:ATP-binding protein [Thermoplasmata archaeon]